MKALTLTPWAAAARRTCAATLSSSEIVVRMYAEHNMDTSLHHPNAAADMQRWRTYRRSHPAGAGLAPGQFSEQRAAVVAVDDPVADVGEAFGILDPGQQLGQSLRGRRVELA